MSTVRVRPATPGDAETLGELSAQLGYPALDVDRRLAEVLGRRDHALLVAELHSRPDDPGCGGPELSACGFVHVFIAPRLTSPPSAELAAMVVHESSRRRGIGRELLAAAEGWARDKGVRHMRVRTRVERAGSVPFYESAGYRNSKTQRVLVKEIDDD